MKPQEIVQKNIEESKAQIKIELTKDNLIIFFTRILEDLKRNIDPEFFGRIKDLYFLIYPYSTLAKKEEILEEIKSSELDSPDGMSLTDEEKNFVKILTDNLNEEAKLKHPKVMKGRINGILNSLSKKYLPNSSEIIEPYLLGKLISFSGSLKNLKDKPSSTIQLLGAEKALFRHISKKEPSPKYGLLYFSKFVQQEKKKGKAARKLANKLSIALRQDYFKFIKNSNGKN